MTVSRPEKGRCPGVGERNESYVRKDGNSTGITKTEGGSEIEGIKTPSAIALITMRRSGRSAYTKLGSFGWLWSAKGKNGSRLFRFESPVFPSE